jgi:hypothetical protein
METLEHILGLCGETHLNIWTIILIAVLFNLAVYKAYRK